MADNVTIEHSSHNEIDLKKLLSILFRHKWKVFAVTLFGLTTAWVYADIQQAVYESKGTLIITESQHRSLGSGDMNDMLASTYGVGLGGRIANELQVLRSRQLSMVLADKVIEEDLMEDGRRFPLIWNEFPNDSTVAYRETVAKRIRDNLYFDRMEQEADVVKISFRSYSPVEARWIVNQVIDSYSEVSTEQNRMAASAAVQFLEKERIEIEGRLSEAQNKLRNFMSNTGLVQIDSQTNLVIDRMSELESRRQELQTRLVSVNVAMEAYEQQLNQIMPGLAERYAESVAPTLDRYQFRLAELETERLLYITRNPALRNNPQLEPELQNINEQISMLKNEINSLASKLIGENGDLFLSFLSSSDGNFAVKITDLRNRLIELQVEHAQMMAQLQAIEERLAVENQFFDNLPDNMVEFASHRRDVQINENLFETISKQYAEMALWEQTQFGLGRPLDYGDEPTSPVEPNIPIYMIIGLMTGFIFGAGFVVVLENNNYRIDGVEKLQKGGYPVLSVIPDQLPYVKKYFKGKSKVIFNKKLISSHWLTKLQVQSPISEAYRRLHTNIIYSHPDEHLKILLVTSCSKGEGKTTIATNLATVLAESGKKVLLLDLDLRRPTIHTVTGEKCEPGLMEVLLDGFQISDVIRDTGTYGMNVLTTGKKVPNPNEVMQSNGLINLIYILRDYYDHIVIDTAPIGIITDAVPIICMADGVVMAVRFGVTRKQELHQTLDRLARIRANVLGTVLAYYKHKSSSDYYYSNLQFYYNYEDYEKYHIREKSGYIKR
jgi:capsular exopolysaccharide synthesis family protein